MDPSARTLVLEDLGAGAPVSRLRVELVPDARVVLSERDNRVEDLSHPFKDGDPPVRDPEGRFHRGGAVRGPEGKARARSVVVTWQPPHSG